MNLKRIKNNLLQADVNDCVKKICSLLKLRPDQKVLLDLGTNDGSKTLQFAGTIDV
jgi:cyclopropane fatty-acyl-phospholipid synthase-like methyltransferase